MSYWLCLLIFRILNAVDEIHHLICTPLCSCGFYFEFVVLQSYVRCCCYFGCRICVFLCLFLPSSIDRYPSSRVPICILIWISMSNIVEYHSHSDIAACNIPYPQMPYTHTHTCNGYTTMVGVVYLFLLETSSKNFNWSWNGFSIYQVNSYEAISSISLDSMYVYYVLCRCLSSTRVSSFSFLFYFDCFYVCMCVYSSFHGFLSC